MLLNLVLLYHIEVNEIWLTLDRVFETIHGVSVSQLESQVESCLMFLIAGDNMVLIIYHNLVWNVVDSV